MVSAITSSQDTLPPLTDEDIRRVRSGVAELIDHDTPDACDAIGHARSPAASTVVCSILIQSTGTNVYISMRDMRLVERGGDWLGEDATSDALPSLLEWGDLLIGPEHETKATAETSQSSLIGFRIIGAGLAPDGPRRLEWQPLIVYPMTKRLDVRPILSIMLDGYSPLPGPVG